MNPRAMRVEGFVREIERIGYRKLKETPNTLHFKRMLISRHEEFHLVIRSNKKPMDFTLHKDNYLLLGKRDEPIEKTSTSLKDKALRDEFSTLAAVFSKTNPRDSFYLACPVCGCNMNYAKLPKHIEGGGCEPGFGGFLSTLWRLDREKFVDVGLMRKYYSEKYGVKSRTELKTAQLREEIRLRREGTEKVENVAE